MAGTERGSPVPSRPFPRNALEQASRGMGSTGRTPNDASAAELTSLLGRRACYRGTSVTGQPIPCAPARRASAVMSGQSSASASAT